MIVESFNKGNKEGDSTSEKPLFTPWQGVTSKQNEGRGVDSEPTDRNTGRILIEQSLTSARVGKK
jgi:hypothetical protein